MPGSEADAAPRGITPSTCPNSSRADGRAVAAAVHAYLFEVPFTLVARYVGAQLRYLPLQS